MPWEPTRPLRERQQLPKALLLPEVVALIILLLLIDGHDQRVEAAATLEEADPIFEAFPISLAIPSEDEARSKTLFHQKMSRDGLMIADLGIRRNVYFARMTLQESRIYISDVAS